MPVVLISEKIIPEISPEKEPKSPEKEPKSPEKDTEIPGKDFVEGAPERDSGNILQKESPKIVLSELVVENTLEELDLKEKEKEKEKEMDGLD